MINGNEKENEKENEKGKQKGKGNEQEKGKETQKQTENKKNEKENEKEIEKENEIEIEKQPEKRPRTSRMQTRRKTRSLQIKKKKTVLNSKILSNELFKKIIKFSKGKEKLKLTKINEGEKIFSIRDFYQKCKDYQNILIVIQINEKQIIGGYSRVGWKGLGGIEIEDNGSFLFLFELEKKPKPENIFYAHHIYDSKQAGPFIATQDNSVYMDINPSFVKTSPLFGGYQFSQVDLSVSHLINKYEVFSLGDYADQLIIPRFNSNTSDTQNIVLKNDSFGSLLYISNGIELINLVKMPFVIGYDESVNLVLHDQGINEKVVEISVEFDQNKNKTLYAKFLSKRRNVFGIGKMNVNEKKQLYKGSEFLVEGLLIHRFIYLPKGYLNDTIKENSGYFQQKENLNQEIPNELGDKNISMTFDNTSTNLQNSQSNMKTSMNFINNPMVITKKSMDIQINQTNNQNIQTIQNNQSKTIFDPQITQQIINSVPKNLQNFFYVPEDIQLNQKRTENSHFKNLLEVVLESIKAQIELHQNTGDNRVKESVSNSKILALVGEGRTEALQIELAMNCAKILDANFFLFDPSKFGLYSLHKRRSKNMTHIEREIQILSTLLPETDMRKIRQELMKVIPLTHENIHIGKTVRLLKDIHNQSRNEMMIFPRSGSVGKIVAILDDKKDLFVVKLDDYASKGSDIGGLCPQKDGFVVRLNEIAEPENTNSVFSYISSKIEEMAENSMSRKLMIFVRNAEKCIDFPQKYLEEWKDFLHSLAQKNTILLGSISSTSLFEEFSHNDFSQNTKNTQNQDTNNKLLGNQAKIIQQPSNTSEKLSKNLSKQMDLDPRNPEYKSQSKIIVSSMSDLESIEAKSKRMSRYSQTFHKAFMTTQDSYPLLKQDMSKSRNSSIVMDLRNAQKSRIRKIECSEIDKIFPLRILLSHTDDTNNIENYTELIDDYSKNRIISRNLISLGFCLYAHNITFEFTWPEICEKREDISAKYENVFKYILKHPDIKQVVLFSILSKIGSKNNIKEQNGVVQKIENTDKKEIITQDDLLSGYEMFEAIFKTTSTSAPNTIPLENEFEKKLLSEVIPPDRTGVSFQNIGALENVKQLLSELVIYPLTMPNLFKRGNLLRPCKGILLYGPPGTGKTMLAKAVATETKANFLNVSMSSISSKWFGEGEKYAKSVFTLARKLSPCIIFIDEVDAVLSKREKNEHEATRRIKNTFMEMWDGLTTNEFERVLVLAATNRPFDLDPAVLRRFSRKIFVDFPDVKNREKILRVILAPEDIEDSFDYPSLASKTENYTGSDLKNLCITAAYQPIRELLFNENQNRTQEFIQQNDKQEIELVFSDQKITLPKSLIVKFFNQLKQKNDPKNQIKLRQLCFNDFLLAMKEVTPSLSPDSNSILALRKWNKMAGDSAEKLVNYYI
ncbi:putative aaa atpase [Anaeramoeba ignava]|uniref:Aaa atpase n=1 Tax=Anaeramoeba ignava TaxID=1746090 RepID=A0A9Q0LFP5_ANAIG|nr:putative aaa atpase [Anaeramoeba ignava]